MAATDTGAFALTSGPVTAAHIRQLVKAGSRHAIAITPDGATVVIEWDATAALADAGHHLPVWTHHEYMCLFGHQDKHKLTPTWAARLAGVANRQHQSLVDGTGQDDETWLRYPKPQDAVERLAHAVALLRDRVRANPRAEAKLRDQIAVPSPLDSDWGAPGYGLTFGDLDDLYCKISAVEGGED